MKSLVLAALSFALVLGALELSLRAVEAVRAGQAGVDNRFIRATNLRRAFTRARVDGEDVYVRTEHHLLPRWPRFSASKDAQTFRVFCLGGSAAMGWPLPGGQAYPALLQRKLELLHPELRFEVINAAGNTYASYRVKIVFDEILDYEPDLVVVYTGNNEFLENVVYRPPGLTLARSDGNGSALRASALARFVEWRLARIPEKPSVDVASYGKRDQLANRLSFAFGRASHLRSDPEQYRTLVDHYVYNLEEMVRAGRRRGVAVMLATVPVNLRDWRPNASLVGALAAPRQRALERALRRGIPALEAGRFDAAAQALEDAVRIDPGVADSWFDLGRASLGQGRVARAKQAFQRALELDGYPFRSLFDEQVKQVARRTGAPLADLSGAIARESAHGIPGFDLLLDYVHPTPRGNEIIAREVLAAMARHGLLPAAPSLPLAATHFEPPELELDQEALRGLFGQTLVMRQYEALERIGAQLRLALEARAPGLSPRERRWNDAALHRLTRTLEVVRPYRELLRAERLSMLAERFTPEQAEAVFRAYAALIREIEGEGISDEQFESYLPQRSAH